MQPFKVLHRNVSQHHAPFIIAEVSGNHGHDIEKAKRMIKAAADAGVHAVKLQTYTADTMTLDISDNEFFIDDPDSLWQGTSLYSLYQKAYTPWEWHAPLFDYAKSLGLIAFSTPFDETAIDFLESLDVPCYKVASFENIDHALLAAVAKTGKPVIMSTGMASLQEISESVAVLRENGCQQLAILKCTSQYPADPVNANLLTIPHMRALFDCEVGLSDHTKGIGVAIAATALGASIIEKHFVLNRDDKDVDAEFSLEPSELEQLVKETARGQVALGRVSYDCTDDEIATRRHRRSLYIARDLKAGEVLTSENLRAIRPGLGLPPKYLSQLLGKPVRTDVKKGTAMRWDLV
ncbi:MAG: pseudaminic acid synthase [Pseudomonadota bacterium]|nr:pseudaminic acid synthase [Pseudomonadota bacterium]